MIFLSKEKKTCRENISYIIQISYLSIKSCQVQVKSYKFDTHFHDKALLGRLLCPKLYL